MEIRLRLKAEEFKEFFEGVVTTTELDLHGVIFKVASQVGGRNKNKYSCENCRIAVWGKPGLHIVCGECGADFTPSEKLPLVQKILKPIETGGSHEEEDQAQAKAS